LKWRSVFLAFLLAFTNSSLGAGNLATATASTLPQTPPRPGADAGPTKVGYAAWLGDVNAIDSVAQSLSGNFLLILRWKDPSLAHAGPAARQFAVDDIWHPRFLITNNSDEIFRSLPEVVDVAPDGTATYRQQMAGRFFQALNLRAFPFDQETFRIQIVVPGLSPREIEFMPEPEALAAGLSDGVGISEKPTLQDWRITRVGSSTQPYEIGPNIRLAALSIEIDAKRQAHHFVVKVIIPLMLIVMMSWAVFWIEPTDAGTQMGVSVTAMLTLIAYRFAIDGDVPKLPYLTRLDAFVLMSTILIFVSMVEVMITSKLAHRDRWALAQLIDRRCRWIFPILFAAGAVATLSTELAS
jgi:hypothetical protein